MKDILFYKPKFNNLFKSNDDRDLLLINESHLLLLRNSQIYIFTAFIVKLVSSI